MMPAPASDCLRELDLPLVLVRRSETDLDLARGAPPPNIAEIPLDIGGLSSLSEEEFLEETFSSF